MFIENIIIGKPIVDFNTIFCNINNDDEIIEREKNNLDK